CPSLPLPAGVIGRRKRVPLRTATLPESASLTVWEMVSYRPSAVPRRRLCHPSSSPAPSCPKQQSATDRGSAPPSARPKNRPSEPPMSAPPHRGYFRVGRPPRSAVYLVRRRAWPRSRQSGDGRWRLGAAPIILRRPATLSDAEPAMSDVTRLLSAIDQGDPHAAAQLLPLVYDELRRLAAQKLAQEKPGQTLQATALVHEAYLRLVDTDPAQPWSSRGHFFAAAQAMR